jgi:polar amino acid transport system substrate-binding protein
MKKIIAIGAITLSLIIASYWLSTRTGPYTTETATIQKTLIVGTNVGYPPFIFTDVDGSVTGFDAGVAAALAEQMGRTLIIKDMAFDALLLALTHGSVDIIIGGISITKARKTTGLLIPYYGTAVDKVALFYQSSSMLQNISLEEAAAQNVSVCTQAGSVFEEIIHAFPGIQLKTLPDISDICLEVSQGHSDIGLLDTDSVAALVRSKPLLKSHTITLKPEQVTEGFGLGVATTNSTLRREITTALEQLKADGAIAQLARIWFEKEI